jgi:hypothetical protein
MEEFMNNYKLSLEAANKIRDVAYAIGSLAKVGDLPISAKIIKTWEDYGAGLEWYTILISYPHADGVHVNEYQALTPRDHAIILSDISTIEEKLAVISKIYTDAKKGLKGE